MTDQISRADAIVAVWTSVTRDSATEKIEALPSAELPKGDLISRADAIDAVASITMSIHLSDVICDKLLALPSADAVEVVRCKDCKYNLEKTKSGRTVLCNYCTHGMLTERDNEWYCADGERREP